MIGARRRPPIGVVRQITRAPSPMVAYLVPWLSVAVGSLLPDLPVIAPAPVMPPLGFLMLLGWRQLRPGLLPVWAGLPLGLVDDLFSGQPFGSAILLWSVTMLALDVIEARFPWRNFVIEWAVAAVMIAAYVALTGGIALVAGSHAPIMLLVPQAIAAVVLYPVVARVIAWLDRKRLRPFRVFG